MTIPFDSVDDFGVFTFQVSYTSESLAGRTVSHDCGLVAETFVHGPVAVTTQTLNSVILLEGDVYPATDALSISGMYGGDWDASVTSTGRSPLLKTQSAPQKPQLEQ